MKTYSEYLNIIRNTPISDGNTKAAIEDAPMGVLSDALEHCLHVAEKTKYNKLAAELRRRYREGDDPENAAEVLKWDEALEAKQARDLQTQTDAENFLKILDMRQGYYRVQAFEAISNAALLAAYETTTDGDLAEELYDHLQSRGVKTADDVEDETPRNAQLQQASHPALFKASTGYYCDAQSRLDVVKKSDWIGGLKDALDHDLQKTVRTAIERRLKKLEAAPGTPSSSSAPANAKPAPQVAPETSLVKITTIVDLDITELQMREDIDHTHVDDLKDCLDELPPITVFRSEGSALYIGDGWHRFLAHKLSNKKEIKAIVHPGGKKAALRHALGANAEHNALRRTNRDKRKAVTIALNSHSAIFGKDKKVKNVAVAEVCKVAESFVRKIRKEIEAQKTENQKTGNRKTAPGNGADPQQDFFDDLNQTFKPVAEGWKTCINHSFFLRPDIPKMQKLNALDEFERQLADHRAQLKAARAKIEAQEEEQSK